MISGKNRFHGRASLRFIYTRGKTVRGPLFAIKCVPNRRQQSYRLAVVVSRKVSKSAVVRNRIRRRLYETVRKNSSHIKQPVDIVITVFSETVAVLPQTELSGQVEKQLSEAGALDSSNVV